MISLKKNDFIIIATVLFLALILFLYTSSYKSDSDTKFARISVDGKEYKLIELKEEQYEEIKIENNGFINIIIVENAAVRMEYSDCPDKICVRHKPISNINDTIVCLPNRVVIDIIGKSSEEIQFDAVSD